jgi:serine/threonine protein kinase
MYRRIVNDKLAFPSYVNDVCQDLIAQLLNRNPSDRLSDPNLMKRHKFFDGIDWELLYQKKIPPPFIPIVV